MRVGLCPTTIYADIKTAVRIANKKPNIILISLDCVRPDFLGCYGCGAVRTPNLDRMAARGMVFDQAVSQAPNTWVSHAGILTGCYPPLHGLRSPYDGILEEVSTLATILKGCGYATAGFPGNDLVGSRMGFGRGFDLFFEEYGLEETSEPGTPGSPFPDENPKDQETRRVTANIRNDWREILEAADRWLAREKEPVFLWFHYLDTHHLNDLQLPEYYRFSRDPHWQFYEGKISYADERCIGAVLDLLRRHGRYEDALMVVLSDHGEGLRPGEVPHHNGELTDDVIRVPLILFGESFPARGVRVGTPVRTADLTPTLAAWVGFHEEAVLERFSGCPLPIPGLTGTTGDGARFSGNAAYAENEPLGMSCVRTEEWKYLRHGKEEFLFHLPSDPGERMNLVRRHPETAGRIRTDLEKIRSQGTARRQAASREEQETRRLLQSLGYIE
jgi:arylsulfatase A-like enzyme